MHELTPAARQLAQQEASDVRHARSRAGVNILATRYNQPAAAKRRPATRFCARACEETSMAR